MTLTFYDAFHGIGGFRYGLEQAGLTCIGGCEIDKFACKAYGVINNERCEPTDIRTVDPFRLPDFDVLVFGWPCQDNSVAGKRSGQREGTRSGLLFEAARILRSKKPRYFIAENVEGLFSVNGGRDFYQTLRLFTDLGYDVQWQLLNTRWVLPQNRERIYFVGHLRGIPRPEVFPIEGQDGNLVENHIRLIGMLDIKGSDQKRRVYGIDGISPCLNGLGQGGLLEPKILVVRDGNGSNAKWSKREVATCLDANYFKGLDAHQAKTGVYEDGRVRKLTPLECFRLQGYPDWWYYKLKEAGISDSQLYKMAGNGVSSPIAKLVGSRLIHS